MKLAQDAAATLTPTLYLRETQRAVHSATTQPLSSSDLQLEAAFDQAFAAAQQAARRGNPVPLARIAAAVRQAYRALVANYTTHTGPTNWVHFTNFAEWGTTAQDFLRPGRGKRILPALQQYNRGGLLDGVHRRAGLDAERRPAHLPADLPGRGDPAGQAVLVGHRVPPAHPGTGAQPGGQVPGRQLHAGPGEEPGRLDHDHHGADPARRRADGQLAAGAPPAVRHSHAGLRPHRQHRQPDLRSASDHARTLTADHTPGTGSNPGARRTTLTSGQKPVPGTAWGGGPVWWFPSRMRRERQRRKGPGGLPGSWPLRLRTHQQSSVQRSQRKKEERRQKKSKRKNKGRTKGGEKRENHAN